MSVIVKIEKLKEFQDFPLPAYATPQSAGVDLLSAIDSNITIPPGEVRLIPTGIKIALPEGYEAQIRPRSGLALKHAITVLNSPGTIDSDYRGEIKVILINLGKEDFIIHKSMKIAQMVIAPYIKAQFKEESLDMQTVRGEGGFGSTGI